MPSPSLDELRAKIDASARSLTDESARVRDLKGLEDLRNAFLSRKRKLGMKAIVSKPDRHAIKEMLPYEF